jgi:cytochrome b561
MKSKPTLVLTPRPLAFIGWAKGHPRIESWAEDKFNSLNSFVFIDNSGIDRTARWSLIPSAQPVILTPEQLKARDPKFLLQDIKQRVASAPQHWDLVITIAGPGDPTSDPTNAWPADRRTINAGTLVVTKVEDEADGPCRDINYDPLRPARRHHYIRRRFSCCPICGLPCLLRQAYCRGEKLPAHHANRRPEMSVSRRFAAPQRLLHWLMAGCIISMLFIGVGMVATVAPKYLTLVQIHKPLGIIILILAVVRLSMRLAYGSPALPKDMPVTMRLAAESSQYAFYALMLGMPLIGWGMLSAASHPVILFGGMDLLPILPVNETLYALLRRAHVYLAFTFYALILAHTAALLFHKFVRKDGVFEAMAPVITPNQAEGFTLRTPEVCM